MCLFLAVLVQEQGALSRRHLRAPNTTTTSCSTLLCPSGDCELRMVLGPTIEFVVAKQREIEANTLTNESCYRMLHSLPPRDVTPCHVATIPNRASSLSFCPCGVRPCALCMFRLALLCFRFVPNCFVDVVNAAQGHQNKRQRFTQIARVRRGHPRNKTRRTHNQGWEGLPKREKRTPWGAVQNAIICSIP